MPWWGWVLTVWLGGAALLTAIWVGLVTWMGRKNRK